MLGNPRLEDVAASIRAGVSALIFAPRVLERMAAAAGRHQRGPVSACSSCLLAIMTYPAPAG